MQESGDSEVIFFSGAAGSRDTMTRLCVIQLELDLNSNDESRCYAREQAGLCFQETGLVPQLRHKRGKGDPGDQGRIQICVPVFRVAVVLANLTLKWVVGLGTGRLIGRFELGG